MKVKEIIENNSVTKICIMTDRGVGIFCGSWYNYYNKNYAKRMNGVNTENGISGTGTDKWIVCTDMDGDVFMIDVGNIKYIKIATRGEECR